MTKLLHIFVLIGLSLGLSSCAGWADRKDASSTNTQTVPPVVAHSAADESHLIAPPAAGGVQVPIQKIEPQPTGETVAPAAPVGEAVTDTADKKIADAVAVSEVQFKSSKLGPMNKNDGLQIKYGELRGIAAQIRGTLLNSGITVIQARAKVAQASDDDSYLELLDRIKAGDYGQAQYVLYGVASQVDMNRRKDAIPGSNTVTEVVELNIAVDFSMVDTTSNEVMASFVARGLGHEMRLVGPVDVPFQPNQARLIQSAEESLAADVEKKLREQGILRVVESPDTPVTNAPASTNSALPKKVLGEDIKTLKVYR